MRIRRTLPILLSVVVVAAVLTLVVQLRKHAPPEAARLLPSADGFLYVNLQWMRRANVSGDLPKVSHDPEYEQFIAATGFQFERDLDEAAFAIHYPTAIRAGASPEPPRFSEVFVGKFAGERLSSYLRKLSHSVDNYRSIDIYSIPLEDRTVRVAILGVDTVAASNAVDPLVIRGIVDRSRKLASPFGGPAFLRQYYKDVPIASLAWTIFRVQPSAAGMQPAFLSFLFSKPAVIVSSVRYLGTIGMKTEAVTESEDEARQLSEQVGTFLNLFRNAEITVSGQASDADVKQFFESLKIEQHKERAILTATIPPGFVKKAIAESPEQLSGETAAPAAPAPAQKKPSK
jgi:hypothetical protein